LIYQQIHTDVMEEGYLQIDETPIRYLAPGHGKTKTGYFWTCIVSVNDGADEDLEQRL
jgi:transposase